MLIIFNNNQIYLTEAVSNDSHYIVVPTSQQSSKILLQCVLVVNRKIHIVVQTNIPVDTTLKTM